MSRDFPVAPRTMILAILLLLLLALAPADCAQDNSGTANSLGSAVADAQNVSSLPDLSPFNITTREPSAFQLGEREIPYSEYVAQARSSELWAQKNAIWTRYLLANQGDMLDLVMFTPAEGNADLYSISYVSSKIIHRSYHLSPGYYSLRPEAAEPGRTMMILAVNSQPGNALIIDVAPRPAEQAGPVKVTTSVLGKARVVIESDNVKGYDVFVDGVFFSSDAADGVVDGKASLDVAGDNIHTITVSQRDGQGNIINKREYTKEFKQNTSYTLRF
jgi:hypothetical protein